MRRLTGKEYFFIALIASCFYLYFSLMTVSEYDPFPKGDAKTYTIMALHFDGPERVATELPIIYSQRLFPAFVAFLFSAPFRDEPLLDLINTPNRTQTYAALPMDRLVRRSWRLSTFIAYFVQLLFIYLLLSLFEINSGLRYYMLVVYSMWFMSVRLYVNWIQMPDPWAFAFLSAAAYYMVKKNTPGFVVSVTLGVLCKETLLFLVPSYIWRIAAEDGLKKKSIVQICLAGAIPPLVFFSHRLHPYFPSTMATPNAPAEAQRMLGGGGSMISDYLFILKYHFIYKLKFGPTYFMDIVFIILGTFAGSSCLLLWRIKDFYLKLKQMKYWLPFLFFTLATSFNISRYLFYAFPPVILFTALIINERYSGRHLYLILLFILLITVWHHEAWLYFSGDSVLDLTLKHQLELASDYGVEFANKYRWLAAESIAAGLTGLAILDRWRVRC